MKIISGKYKGRVLEGFNLNGTRPTMDRVKESLFAMIQDKIIDSVCLDLFSGSGNLGLEALSEGAKEVILVDHNRKAINVINQNIKKMNIPCNCRVINQDYKKVLNNFNSKVDVIFLDPPYNTNYIEDAILLISKNNILNNKGIIVCESDDLSKIVYGDDFLLVKSKKYGDKFVVIIQKI